MAEKRRRNRAKRSTDDQNTPPAGDNKPPESLWMAVFQVIWRLQERQRKLVLSSIFIGCLLFASWIALPEPAQLGIIAYLTPAPEEPAERSIERPNFLWEADRTILAVFVIPPGWSTEKAVLVAINELAHHIAREFPDLDLQERDALLRSRDLIDYGMTDQFAFRMTLPN